MMGKVARQLIDHSNTPNDKQPSGFITRRKDDYGAFWSGRTGTGGIAKVGAPQPRLPSPNHWRAGYVDRPG
jgi:hypothetical protein